MEDKFDDFFLFCKVDASPQCTDRGSRANMGVSFFRGATTSTQHGTFNLNMDFGQRPVQGYPDTADVYPTTFIENDMAIPVGGGSGWWEQVWNDAGSGASKDYTCWKIRDDKIPLGFVCLSPCFFKVQGGGRDPPSDTEVDGMVMVNQELVSFVEGSKLVEVWNDHGSRVRQEISIYTGPDSLGSFAFPHYLSPSGDFPILNRAKGRLILSRRQLSQTIDRYNAHSFNLLPSSKIPDEHVMSSSVARIQKLWTDNASNLRDDFAKRMKEVIASASKNDVMSTHSQAEWFCGVLKLVICSHELNVVLLPDETLMLFDPKNNYFFEKDDIAQFLSLSV